MQRMFTTLINFLWYKLSLHDKYALIGKAFKTDDVDLITWWLLTAGGEGKEMHNNGDTA